MNPIDLTVHELQERLRRRDLSAVELARTYLQQIAASNPLLNSFVTVCGDQALADARAADARLAAGEARPLTGIPLALKDIFLTAGVRTTCASRILENFIAPYDGTAVAKLKEQGAVLLGKLNMDEFAMGSSNENSHFGAARNPWDPDCVPGGSSGGSAAAVAARQAAATLGTDTGGSIRQPAAHCGVVGLKPTYGRVSRYGVIAYASSLDQVGPLARDVEDCALMLQAVAGYDPLDSTSVDTPVPDYAAALKGGVKGLKIGLPREYFIEGLDPEVRSAVEAAIAEYRRLGAELVEISLPHTDLCGRLLLPDRHRRGFQQPRPLRRGALRAAPRPRPGADRHVQRQPRRRLRHRGQAAHHARHLRPLLRLLRRLLPQGAEGPHPDPPGLPRRLRTGRRDPHPGGTDRRLPPRGEDRRSPADVPLGHLHHPGQPRRHLRTLPPLRGDGGRPADRPAAHRPPLR